MLSLLAINIESCATSATQQFYNCRIRRVLVVRTLIILKVAVSKYK